MAALAGLADVAESGFYRALITRLGAPAGAALAWADLAQTLTLRARRGRAVNLDPAALLMDMLLKIDEAAGILLAQR